ncbi:hypothetical protein C7964_101837 [Loktanella sp. PT4BL]|jgi:hypothetical protein|uniref:hypothetical protein n=1 Tax=Loktanella sp. PT4BL TaxID=2135611 RepID=UPI000D76709A|nr:hypothetical protein [Loktanella sp. PT4BL]PXW72721.1 hypothetical protein C7964_101837 [Loktanella sp. PT4BL]
MTPAAEKIDIIANALKDDVSNKRVFALLDDLRKTSLSLDHGQKSETFHNMLRSFNRMWGDEFSPKYAVVTPLLNDLFDMHGFPAERSKAK